MQASKLVLVLLFAYLGYDHYTSDVNDSHLSGIGSFVGVTTDAIQGRTPACTVEGSGLIYWALVL